MARETKGLSKEKGCVYVKNKNKNKNIPMKDNQRVANWTADRKL